VITREDRDAFVAQAHARAVRKVARSVGKATLVVGAGFWGLFLVVTVAVPLVVDQAGGVMGGGVMTGAEYAVPWFALSLGTISVGAILTTHVSAGGTRRAMYVGALGAVLVSGVAYGVLHVLLLLAERSLFGALGWEWDQLGSSLEPGGTWTVVTGAATAISVAVYMLVGMAVVASFQTSGLWRGVLLLLPGLALLVLVDVATGSGAFDDAFSGLLPGDGDLPAVVGLPAGLALLALAAAWLWWQLRGLRLRPAR
ncbi:MAG: hypothetical protein ACRDQ0_22895, partial [Pseudonocardia sp.]